MKATIKKDNSLVGEYELSRVSLQNGNLALGVKSADMIQVPFIRGTLYRITVEAEQTIEKQGLYVSYNYQVFSETKKDDSGMEITDLICADNSLLFQILS